MLIIPTVVLLEMRYLSAKGRIPALFAKTEAVIRSCPNSLIWPVTAEVVRRAPLSLDIHDAIICGSALNCSDEYHQSVSIITRDRAIREWGGLPVIG